MDARLHSAGLVAFEQPDPLTQLTISLDFTGTCLSSGGDLS